MNEKIKEFAGQAGATDIGLDHLETFIDLKHFAELLVRACGNFTDPVTRNLMMKHFGVEE